MTGVVDRRKLTDVWKENGITKNYEYAVLTNEIYQAWSGMKASEYNALSYKYLDYNKLDKKKLAKGKENNNNMK